ncbi:ATP-dependent Clp protease adaptor ClpS [Campylobacter volucris]|uniref:ATP-dependent Clp protease adapter protein ClpS n=1 Tax=Campylobacter volucris TaxID=1031542 RepID=A0A5C8L277_9BACT|nr:ATP-dependent Clp protease adaptor ClpS [Campylobacter volucris]AJC94340.1 ATP-dependent Clp protease adaptor protein ClpS [Campylobacter volucris LMG 24379]KAB0580490.1 ATP-dependent Clp protease adaptor ClpS [Campylobacter volucris]MBF7044278.1 ATP-dependent Clp protease adaptor ClpS [Campylobacter volucris]MBF7045153.1 ATP-dependent Clp protease adaptor ClpS [Campylobacter volucris]MBF7048489.1 ATP-dependent Clp protease adaptor ClpS [Campylobacter volucris]
MSLKNEILEQQKLAQPKLFKVLLLNDDITTMEFVVDVLINIFHHDFEKASAIMLEIHHQGSGVCGIYTEEIALSKKQQVDIAAKNNNFPLQTRIEEQ